ncbi:hypothetical protein NK983_35080, partial [Salmonella enterica subsp. enterica serovar Typhimurium]|nr:hypothetical protein [Salmonella enterica subsp. enterica serovar Typhimurium]
TLDVDGVLRHAWLHAGTHSAGYPHPALALMQVGSAGDQGTSRLQRADTPQTLHPAPTESAPEAGWLHTDRMAIRFLG